MGRQSDRPSLSVGRGRFFRREARIETPTPARASMWDFSLVYRFRPIGAILERTGVRCRERERFGRADFRPDLRQAPPLLGGEIRRKVYLPHGEPDWGRSPVQ